MGGKLSTTAGTFDTRQLHPAGSELHTREGRLETSYSRCGKALSALTPEEIARKEAFVERATADLGLHTDWLRESPEAACAFSMDLFPRILRSGEWRQIEAGVLQRTQAFAAYIRDIHTNKDILRAGRVPPEPVFEDPAFHPELHEIPASVDSPIILGAVDLVRTVQGEWMVVENRFSTPTGLSYVIQVRRILAQVLPEAFQQLPVLPVASFVNRFSEALADTVRDASHSAPLILLLSEGEEGRHFFEESFLARHMGIPLAKPADLIVRDGRVFLKTIAGLDQVHVIYRRVEPDALDPVAFASPSETGVPGILHCIRRGTVKVANVPGCAVADNRAILPYSDSIIHFYTGKQKILRTVPTFSGYDYDQLEWIRDNIDTLSLKAVCHPEILGKRLPDTGRPFEQKALVRLLETDPRMVVAQAFPELSRLPVHRGGKLHMEPATMRVYCLMGRHPVLLPGGLSRLHRGGNESLGSGKRFHALKDTWLLRQKQPQENRKGRLEQRLHPPMQPLPSRAAESFYWMGRYLERGSGLARMLNVLEELRWNELSPREREIHTPLWQAVLTATEVGTELSAGTVPPSFELTRKLLSDESDPASARACLQAFQENAKSIRSLITPEVWQAAVEALEIFRKQVEHPGRPETRQLCDSLVRAGDRIYGTATRTLLHDAGWQFFNIGILLERALRHSTILHAAIPYSAAGQWRHLRDDSDLTGLLRLLGALDAYHRNYRSRAYLDRVADLLWKSPHSPASVLFCSRQMLLAIEAISSDHQSPLDPVALRNDLESFLAWLLELDLDRIFPARTHELDHGITRATPLAERTTREAEACLKRMRKFFENLHHKMEDRFFSHHPEIRTPE